MLDFGIDVEYETVLAVLYASYAPAQIPSNMVRFNRLFSVVSCLKST